MAGFLKWSSNTRATEDDQYASLPLNASDGDDTLRHVPVASGPVPRWLQPSAKQARGWFYKLIPFCIAAPFGLTERKLPKVASTTYLNGVRGLACWVVLNHHLTGEIDRPWIFRPYGVEPLAENNHFVQLPLIRAVHTGKGMVCIFFALSGFVLSYSTLRKVNSKSGLAVSDELLTSFCSSILRRGIRLFAPMLALVFIQAFVCRYVPFVSDFDDKAPNLFQHLLNFWHQAVPVMNPFNWRTPEQLPNHFQQCWTLGYEYRLSLAVFLMLIATCRLRTVPRKAILVGFMAWANYVDQRWDIICFFGGMIVAELRFAPLSADIGRLIGRPDFKPNKWISTVAGVVAVLLGLMFCSWPENQPGAVYPYKAFYWITPQIFQDSLKIAPGEGWIWYWGSIGAVLMIWGLEQLPLLQRFLAIAPISYLGEISYSFYLFQRMARVAVGEPILKYVVKEWQWSHVPAFVLYYFSTLIWTILVSDYFWRAVDLNSVVLARKVVVDWLGVGKKVDIAEAAYAPVPSREDMAYGGLGEGYDTSLPMTELEPKARD
ncbi:acyltransferase family-domain-containing protein [Microdochium trichocladiopsis]|uniref:Acyltransferase family-domain-containing protein n=1 Tax=Microdochium trichocladiopsis TaxID=1682393 RepID=A0A9P8YGH5_9PEZI|nr:acyltransferase family-domain-containing protein [Microdochium trichocladiopsis]KAH7037554.1 acyltransferase family-domain-containing protein [Microdochium trichocladiopsis]